MKSIDLIAMGFRNLWRRKLRTFLTVLGVIIGTASIVIMVSLGFGMTESFRQQVSQMGNLHVITVQPSYSYDGSSSGDTPALDDQAVSTFSTIPGVQAVTPVLETYMKIVSGKYVAHVSIKGILPETMEAFDFTLSDGRLLTQDDSLHLVFGAYMPSNFYNPSSRNNFYYNYDPTQSEVDVLNDRLELTFDMSYGEKRGPSVQQPGTKAPKVYKVNGVGILQAGDYQNDYSVFMPLDQLKKLVDENKKTQQQSGGRTSGRSETNTKDKYQQILVKVKDMDQVQAIQTQIKDMGYNAYSLNDWLESMKETASMLQTILGGIGAVSLLVAALGITNTMIMSIYERTREIGIMKVIGAALKDIRRLFLLEAGLIGLSGGLAGIAFSYGVSYLMNNANISLFGGGMMGGKISIIPLWLALATIGFSTLVGLVSGFYPARRAMKLSALEAIKTE